MQDSRKTKSQLIDELRELNRQLDIEEARERVRREVLSMRSMDDLKKVVGVLFEEMRRLGVQTPACNITFVDEERDYGVDYVAMENPRKQGIGWTSPDVEEVSEEIVVYVCEGTLSTIFDAEAFTVPNWREGGVRTGTFTPETSLEVDQELVDVCGFTRRLGWIGQHWEGVAVYFEHGKVGFREKEYIEEHVAVVQQLTQALSLGFVRFLDFQQLEEQNRRLSLERSIERVRAEASAMRASADLGKLILAMQEGLREAGLRFFTASINIVDERAGTFRAYSINEDEVYPREMFQDKIIARDIRPGIYLVRSAPVPLELAREQGWAQPDLEADFWICSESFPEALRQLWEIDFPGADTMVGWHGLSVPFSHGGVFAFALEGERFDQDDLELAAQFADAISLGYTRYLDLQAIEERNRQLILERAVERVRVEALSMRSMGDMKKVVAVLSREMATLGFDPPGCNITLIDEERDYGVDYVAVPNPRKQGIEWSNPAVEEMSEETVVFVREATASTVFDAEAFSAPDWRESGVRTLAFTREISLEMDTALIEVCGFTRPPDWVGQEWVGGAVFFPHGKVGFRMREHSEEQIAIMRQLTRALSFGVVRFFDFQRLEEQNQALARANRHIEETTRRKSDFLARMSHDLRTPMNAIIGYTRILMRRCRDALDERQYRNLENIQTSSQNLLSLINEILDLSRVEAGRIDIQVADVDLGRLAAECAVAVEPLVGTDVRLVREIGEAPPLRTDPEILRKVLMNLLGNAVKFTDAGSITLSLRSAGEQMELAVADTGVGIPAEDLPYIFEEFRQVERQGDTEKEGTGLGLAIARKSVELLGGTLAAESEAGAGTRFTLRIGNYRPER